MKKGIQLFVLFNVLIVQTKSYSPLAFGRQTFLPISKSLKSMSRIERQDASDGCQNIVQEVINEQVCSSSFGQNYVNLLSQCNVNISMDVINAVEMFCRKNSAGEFCGSIDFDNAMSKCNSSFSSNSCATECREVLTNAGCCFSNFTFLNGLFALCQVEFPASCPKS